jgi:hypothetical protein
MTVCQHPRTGWVTSRPLGGIEGPYAAAPVCNLPECIAEAKAWVSERVHGKTAHYVADEVTP